MDPQTTDTEIHEDQFLTFIVNLLTETFDLPLGEIAKVDPVDPCKVLVGATADGDSISTLCKRTEDTQSGDIVLRHFRTKFDLDSVAGRGTTLVQKDLFEVLPGEAKFVVDLHMRPYYGEEDDTAGLYRNEAMDGTIYFHAYTTFYVRLGNERYTLAMRRVTEGNAHSEVLAGFLGVLDNTDIDVNAVYLDEGSTTASVSPYCTHTMWPTSCP